MNSLTRSRGCLLGLACGDAVGTTVEFRARGSFRPLTDMVGGGPFGLPKGAWTDDTSMALCLATSLAEKNGFDPLDQMERYVRWRDEGYLSSIGECFDIGGTTSSALNQFRLTGDPFSGSTDPRAGGNGSIMRLAPVPLFFHPDHAAAIKWAGESSRTTHGSPECVDACRLLAGIICHALDGRTKEEILFAHGVGDLQALNVQSIARGDYRDKKPEQIKGTGYVVQSLEAALWCFWTTKDFRAAILAAANLGDDADTTAAICGQVAGAFYGETGIPDSWLSALVMRQEIGALVDRLHVGRSS